MTSMTDTGKWWRKVGLLNENNQKHALYLPMLCACTAAYQNSSLRGEYS